MEILLLPWLFIKILCVLLLNMKISQFHIFSIESVALCCDVTHFARMTIVPLRNWCGSSMWYPNNGNNIIIPEYFGSKCSFVAAMTDTLPNSMLLVLICSVNACQTQRGGRQHDHAYFSALTRWMLYWVSYHFINILVYMSIFNGRTTFCQHCGMKYCSHYSLPLPSLILFCVNIHAIVV